VVATSRRRGLSKNAQKRIGVAAQEMAEIAKLGQGAEALAATAKFDLQMNDDLGKSKDQGFSNILMIKRE